MSEIPFRTHEIGSIDKLNFRVKATGKKPLTEKDIKEAMYWADKVGLEQGLDKDLFLHHLTSHNQPDRRNVWKKWALMLAVRFFESAGLDYVYNGEQWRSEMYQDPIGHVLNTVSQGRAISWGDGLGGKYYRRAAAIGPVSLDAPFHVEEFELTKTLARKPLKVCETGPYTLADWSDIGEHYFQKREAKSLGRLKHEAKRELVLGFARDFLRPHLQALRSAGAEWIQIDEPAFTTDPQEVGLAVEGFNEATQGLGGRFSIHICYASRNFGGYEMLYPGILELKNCSQYALEFANRAEHGRRHEVYSDFLKLTKEYGDKRELGLGVIDIHTNRVESPEEVSDALLYQAGYVDPARLWAIPDCGLRTRTWEVSYAKLQALTQGAKLARKALESR